MILQTANLGCFTVHFQHAMTEGAPRRTRCVIHAARKEKCTGNLCGATDALQGQAHCAAGDMFDKSRGRKVALARALKSLPRQSRAEIWTAYFNFIGHF
jgi:hypothetical protein